MKILIQEIKSEIKACKNKNLEYDPYFYERQKELHQIRDDIKNGKIGMVSHEQIWKNIKKHISL